MKKFQQERDAIWNEVEVMTRMTLDQHQGELEKRFGKDFCKKHPEVLASIVQSTMTAWGSALIAAAIQDLKDK